MKASLREAFSRSARVPWEKRTSNPHAAHCDGAVEPESIGIYVDHTGEPEVDHTGEPVRKRKYARVPWEVACDEFLKPLDVRVYCIISGGTYQGSTCKIGTRRIAEFVHASRRLVIESIDRLEQRGHIQRNSRNRARGTYFLSSEIFSQKQRAGIEEVALGPNCPRLVSVRKEQGTASTLTSFPKRQKALPKSSGGTGQIG
jgi:predicted transcriptional regulator